MEDIDCAGQKEIILPRDTRCEFTGYIAKYPAQTKGSASKEHISLIWKSSEGDVLVHPLMLN